MSKALVGIDVGTSSCKVCIFDTEGNLLGSGAGTYPCYFPKPDWVEQKEEDILPAVFKACKEAVIDSAVEKSDIAAVSFSTMSSTTTLVGENNRTLCNIFGWQDARGGDPDIFLEMLTGASDEEFYEITGHPIIPLMAVPAKYLWVKNNMPGLLEGTPHVCSIQDWLLREFGADGYYIDVPNAVRLGLADSTKRVWSEHLIGAAGLRTDQMSEIVFEAGKVVGHVTAEAAAKSGLPVGCPVCVGAHDQDCCALGSGAIKSGIAVMTIGTLGTYTYMSDKPLRVEDMDIISHAKQGLELWSIELLSASSASAFKWFSDMLCNAEDGITNPCQPVSFDMIGDAAAKSPIGSNNILFIPELVNRQGSFSGISLGTTKGDMARSIMEGICFYMRDAIEAKEHLGIHASEVRLAGGVSKNPFWCQMLADILKKEVLINTYSEVGCIGAAIFAGVGSGQFKNIDEAVAKMVKFPKRYTPKAENFEAYDAAFQAWKEYKDYMKNYQGSIL